MIYTVLLDVRIIAKAIWPAMAMLAYCILAGGKVVSTQVIWIYASRGGGSGGLPFDLAA